MSVRLFLLLFLVMMFFSADVSTIISSPTRILVDTDMDTDDFFAILYLLKQNKSLIDLKAITISANAWVDAGHGVNHVYDLLYMMGRDDVVVGVGGEGEISRNGTIFSDVGGYLPIIEQGISTVGNCRYRQVIPVGSGGRLDIDTNYGIRRALLPQGTRRYAPLQQPSVQKVMLDTISAGPTTVFLIGSHTNLAIFLMKNPQLRKNIEHVFVMGGGVNSNNPKRCCPPGRKKSKTPCNPQCGILGNLFTAFDTNPLAEFNFFCDPFAAYTVFHSGLPVTLVPLDATNTIPITKGFYEEFGRRQETDEARYCFQSLKMIHDTQMEETFYAFIYLWDSFMAGVAVSIIRNGYVGNGKNEFADMRKMSLTVVTSDPPYGVLDGSNPLFDGRDPPLFNLEKSGVHSGHVQTGRDDSFCLVANGTKLGRCQDGYTKEVVGSKWGAGVRMLVAQKAKSNDNKTSPLDREYFVSLLDYLNRPAQSGRFNFTTQFPYYREVLYKPELTGRLGKAVVLDMDMSAGDFLSLLFLLKVPRDEIDIKGVLVSGNGWANPASIDMVYDMLHMMGRDDIPVGLGSTVAMETPSFSCKYVRYIPHGGGGFIDSDTLYGLARNLPRSPRRYSADRSTAFGALWNTSHPELRQPSALEVWKSISGGPKITLLTTGPLTNLGNILASDGNANKVIQEVFIVGGHVTNNGQEKGNIFSLPSNRYSEFNFFLDPIAATKVMRSNLSITLVPLGIQRGVSSFPLLLKAFGITASTPELTFARNLVSTLYNLQKKHPSYKHVDMFLGEVLGAVVLAKGPNLSPNSKQLQLEVVTGDVNNDGRTIISNRGKAVKVMDGLNKNAYYNILASLLSNKSQSAMIGSFDDQMKQWSTPPRKPAGAPKN